MAKNINFIRSLSRYAKLYQKKVRIYPRYADLRNMLGLLYYIQSRHALAAREFRRALSINPRYEEARVNLSFSLRLAGQKKRGRDELLLFYKEKKSATHGAPLALCIMFFQDGETRKAERYMREALRRCPEDPFTLTVSGICSHALGRGREARDLFRKAQKLSYVVASRHRDLELYDLGKFDFSKIERLYPYYMRNPFVNDLLVRIAEELERSEKTEQSRSLISFALTRGVPSSRMLNFMGLMALRSGRETDAIRLFAAAFSRDRHNAYPAIHLFFIYGERGEWKKAGAILEEALRANPGYADLHNYRGVYYGDMGRRAAARRELKKAISINPGYIDALYNLASLCEDSGDPEEELKAYLRLSGLQKMTPELQSKISALSSRLKPSRITALKKQLPLLISKKSSRKAPEALLKASKKVRSL